MMTALFTYLFIGLLWLLHWLPLPILGRLGAAVGCLLYYAIPHRRRVVLRNLELCFPEWPLEQRQALAKSHFKQFGRSFLERSLLWFASEVRLFKLIQIEGLEQLEAASDQPQIWLCPHFLALDVAGQALCHYKKAVSIYSAQKNQVFDAQLKRARARFNAPLLVSRNDSIRPVIKAMREGLPLFLLPDLDLGTRDAVFVPFFGVPAATVTTVARLAKMTNAKVFPVIGKVLPNYAGYAVKIYPAWDNYPTDDLTADTRRMNAFIEERVLEMPEQYYWVHKRFKNRPAGEPNLYSRADQAPPIDSTPN